jgi:hypothetical protein
MEHDTAHDATDLNQYTAEDYLDLLRSNVLAMAAGTMAFLRERAIPATDWAASLGEVFARAWDTDQTWSPEDFLDATIINLTAFGGEAIQAEFGEEEATALIADFPAIERVAGLALGDVEADLLYDLIGPIARACGLTYDWLRDGENVRITVRVAP